MSPTIKQQNKTKWKQAATIEMYYEEDNIEKNWKQLLADS